MSDETTRRAFVAGLAALGLLPNAVRGAGARVSSDRVELTHGEHGTTCASVEPGSPMYGSVEINEFDDWETEISVAGYGYDDEDPDHVEMKATVDGASVTFSCSPERAREFADELRTAAKYAEANGGEW
jgi:hypothetical protein